MKESLIDVLPIFLTELVWSTEQFSHIPYVIPSTYKRILDIIGAEEVQSIERWCEADISFWYKGISFDLKLTHQNRIAYIKSWL